MGGSEDRRADVRAPDEQVTQVTEEQGAAVYFAHDAASCALI